jgi:DNA-binding transcriptional MerR regulator/methylmalonyl-CoA mutase cobalamin-binding subunit
MSRDPAAGRYRIQAVVELTGVSAATLRAWERRYGIPKPQRSHASYRLYSDQDIEAIQRLRDLCDRGMAPSEAARLVAGSAAEVVDAPAPIEGDVFKDACSRALAAVEGGDVVQLRAICERALDFGSAMQLLDRLVVPVMREIGDRWFRGELSVASEHLASEQLGNLARELARLLTPELPWGKALLACAAWETHALPLYVVAARWSQWGLAPIVLGARLPADQLADAIARTEPRVVGISITVELPRKPAIAEALGAYAEACGDVPWVVGGHQTADLKRAIEKLGGFVAPSDVVEHRALIDQLRRRAA